MSVDKGKRFELKVAKLLSEWSGIELGRTPMSGAWWKEYGVDIWPKDQMTYFPLAVECKCEESWSLEQILRGTGLFFTWQAQAISQALELRKYTKQWYEPLLIFSKNRSPIYVAFDSWNLEPTDPIFDRCMIVTLKPIWYVVEFDAFLNRLSFNYVKSCLNFYWTGLE